MSQQRQRRCYSLTTRSTSVSMARGSLNQPMPTRGILLARVGDRAEARGRHQLHVLAENALGIARLRRLPRRATAAEFGIVHIEPNEALFRIDRDAVAFVHQRNGAADVGLGRD